MISLENISVRFGAFELFNNISLMINRGEKVGLVGNNGAGKTTLLRLMVGIMKADEGEITIPKDSILGYLPQQMNFKDDKDLLNEALTAFSGIIEIEKEIKEINHQLAERKDYNSRKYKDLIHRLSAAHEEFNLKGGQNMVAETERTLTGLGFIRDEFAKATSEFSGGWRMRIELAKLLLRKPDFLLLDEPTNHLDIESIQWIEEYLKEYQGGVILISHDRAFLDNVTNRTVELSLANIFDYKVPYSRFVELRKERRETQLAAYKNQQKKISDTQQFIDRFRYQANKAVQVQSRIKFLEKLERIEVEDEDVSSINIKFPPSPRAGSIVIEAEDISKSYGKNYVLDSVDFIIERGEKVAFVGKNGEGKTTFARIINGEIGFNGNLKKGNNVITGYFAQNQDETLELNKTVFQTIDDVAKGDIRTKIRDILGAFLFSGDEIDKQVKVLSGGERSRLALIKLLLKPYNLLIMDEPTNHLDMRSKEILKNALSEYDGTLIIVSHDREFLDGLTTKIFEFKDRKIKENTEGIYDFLKRKKIESLNELDIRSKKQNGSNVKNTSNKEQYLRKKKYEKNLRKLKKNVYNLEGEIGIIERKIEEKEKVIASPEKYPDHEIGDDFFLKYEELKKQLEAKLNEWEKRSREVDKYKEKKPKII